MNSLKENRGAVLVLVAILMTTILGFTALAIDIGNLVMVRNQLQNAADAGALAGAAELYDDYGTAIQASANQTAYDIVVQNTANSTNGVLPAESNWSNGNTGDIQRGHWSFATRIFTPKDSLLSVDLWGKTERRTGCRSRLHQCRQGSRKARDKSGRILFCPDLRGRFQKF